ncbi:hypothetical protein NC651_012837 [Populus alba x Populus x berolinensis]|nr:hypothetical protein NC651_012837 [Populus alba x Populus x berolinensis]
MFFNGQRRMLQPLKNTQNNLKNEFQPR